jgi:hypothetical protein
MATSAAALQALCDGLMRGDVTAGAINAVVDGEGRTPLHMAACERLLPAVRLLVAAGAEVDARDQAGVTPLMFAAGRDDEGVVVALLAAGADVDAQDVDGSTGLHRAALWGNAACVGALLEGGARVDVVDGDGRTAEHVVSGRARVPIPACPPPPHPPHVPQPRVVGWRAHRCVATVCVRVGPAQVCCGWDAGKRGERATTRLLVAAEAWERRRAVGVACYGGAWSM